MRKYPISVNLDRLHEIREAHGLSSIGRVADLMGIPRPHFYQMIRGRKPVGLTFIVQAYITFGEPFTTRGDSPLYRIDSFGSEIR